MFKDIVVIRSASAKRCLETACQALCERETKRRRAASERELSEELPEARTRQIDQLADELLQRVSEAKTESKDLRSCLDRISGSIECIVCMERSTAFSFNCGHCYCCHPKCPSTRLSEYVHPRCPLCQKKVQKHTKLYGALPDVDSILAGIPRPKDAERVHQTPEQEANRRKKPEQETKQEAELASLRSKLTVSLRANQILHQDHTALREELAAVSKQLRQAEQRALLAEQRASCPLSSRCQGSRSPSPPCCPEDYERADEAALPAVSPTWTKLAARHSQDYHSRTWAESGCGGPEREECVEEQAESEKDADLEERRISSEEAAGGEEQRGEAEGEEGGAGSSEREASVSGEGDVLAQVGDTCAGHVPEEEEEEEQVVEEVEEVEEEEEVEVEVEVVEEVEMEEKGVKEVNEVNEVVEMDEKEVKKVVEEGEEEEAKQRKEQQRQREK
eukprot:1778108-Rhodomonas_salina.2